ncbi:hypothetical protein M422DRAFT_36801 [Sphaerobolus stellatus SS14]|uniref:Uncharacterized protein n=1 Tax=Sphaerobolus stellatus (strain SS14) TaxID=990650 RepID=A0A0C9UM70_SPHS4|nr:hypothetical protein M422DRAFT_36801 [Sphaerobolus stellatus SS14]
MLENLSTLLSSISAADIPPEGVEDLKTLHATLVTLLTSMLVLWKMRGKDSLAQSRKLHEILIKAGFSPTLPCHGRPLKSIRAISVPVSKIADNAVKSN